MNLPATVKKIIYKLKGKGVDDIRQEEIAERLLLLEADRLQHSLNRMSSISSGDSENFYKNGAVNNILWVTKEKSGYSLL